MANKKGQFTERGRLAIRMSMAVADIIPWDVDSVDIEKIRIRFAKILKEEEVFCENKKK